MIRYSNARALTRAQYWQRFTIRAMIMRHWRENRIQYAFQYWSK